ncbi:MAG TPA: amidase, partial [Gemmatimonadales bacterium]|nr:amidase [Gemmatimonadales bacterium]
AQCSGVVGVKPTFGLIPRSGVLPTWPYLDTHGPMARNVADAALVIDALLGPDGEDALAFDSPPSQPSYRSLDPASLRGARLGIPETHIPRDRMSSESLANFDRAVADLRGAGAEVITFSPRLFPANYRRSFAEFATARGDAAPDAYAPGPTANALLRYFRRHGGDAAAMVRRGHEAFRAFYDVLPESWEEMSRVMQEPYERSAAGQSFARSRAEAVRQLADDLKEYRIEAMVYPTMPYPAFRLADGWPNIPTTLGYGNWLGIPEVSVPAGYGSDGMPSGNLSFVGTPGRDARLLALAHSYQEASGRFVLARR